MGRLTKEQISYIQLNINNTTTNELAKKFGCNKSTISNWRRKLHISFSELHDFTQFHPYIIDNYQKKTSTALAKEINCSKSYIGKVWMEAGLKGKICRKYYSNFKFFHNIDSSHKAYVLGLTAADGCIYTREHHEGLWQISLQQTDFKILEDIKQVLESENPINISDKMATLTIVSQTLYDDLVQLGITPKKTYTLDMEQLFSNIPIEFQMDFIRGYFDGDGSITVRERPSASKVQFALPKTSYPEIQRVLLMNGVESCWNDYHNLEKYTIPFGTLVINGTTNKYCFLKLIYQNSNCLCLQRKKELSQQLFYQIENNITNRSENKTAVLKWGELLENLRR